MLGKQNTAAKTSTLRSIPGFPSKWNTVILRKFDNAIPTELKNGYGAVPQVFGNVLFETLAKVSKAPYHGHGGTFDKYEAVAQIF